LASGVSAAAVTPTTRDAYELNPNTRQATTNRLAGANSDAAGNQQAIAGGTFTYDAENRLKQSDVNKTTVYRYDGDGRRVQKIQCALGTAGCDTTITGAVVTTYVYDAMGELAAEWTNAPDATSPATTAYPMADHLGSIRLVTDSTGAVKECHDYLPFGEEIVAGVGDRGSCYPANPAKGPLFTGKERDGETQTSANPPGLDFFGARYFSAALGRFTTPDWSAAPEPVPYADLGDPQTLNLYGYVRGNPLRFRDPDGHGMWDWVWTVLAPPKKKTPPPPPPPPRPPAPPPPPFLKPNPTFPSVDAAGLAAAKLANNATQRGRVEFGTRIFKIAPGQYSYSDLVSQGVRDRVDVDSGRNQPRVPPGTTLAGTAHAHPLALDLAFERFSGQDRANARIEHIPTYLGTPSGSIIVYNPTVTPERHEYLEYHR
jgi:RHS repeat-associated protein